MFDGGDDLLFIAEGTEGGGMVGVEFAIAQAEEPDAAFAFLVDDIGGHARWTCCGLGEGDQGAGLELGDGGLGAGGGGGVAEDALDLDEGGVVGAAGFRVGIGGGIDALDFTDDDEVGVGDVILECGESRV